MPDPIREQRAARAAGPLSAVVAEHHGYRSRHVAPERHLGLPSPWVTVIFALDEPLELLADPGGPERRRFGSLVGGLHTTPAHVVHDGAQSGIQLQLSPLGTRALFGLPAGELAGIDATGAQLLGGLAGQVRERLVAEPDWDARFAILDEHLGAVVDTDRPPAEVCRAWALLMRSGGTASIADLAREVGWGERHLAARFRTEIGLTPKLAARVIRFDHARRLLQCARGRSGAEVAAHCGYADQSHLVRDFVAFTGLSPTAWLAGQVRNVQAEPPGDARGLAS